MANCCNGETCEKVVTIGYMREMANVHKRCNDSSKPCVVVSSATPFDSCCSANESAYTPTYSDIINKRYATVRSLDNQDPGRDVNGFSASTPSLDTTCCENVSIYDKLLKQGELSFGYTKIKSVELSCTTQPTKCNTSFKIRQKNTYERHNYICENGEIKHTSSTAPVTFNNAIEGELEKEYGQIEDGVSNITIKSKKISRSVTDSCGCYADTDITITASPYTASVTLDCDTQIPCDGGDILATIVDDCYEVTIVGASLNTGEDVTPVREERTKATIHIPRNEKNYTETTLTLSIVIGKGSNVVSGEVSCTFTREVCKITPEPPDIPCGTFPLVEDDWCGTEGLNVINCDGTSC